MDLSLRLLVTPFVPAGVSHDGARNKAKHPFFFVVLVSTPPAVSRTLGLMLLVTLSVSHALSVPDGVSNEGSRNRMPGTLRFFFTGPEVFWKGPVSWFPRFLRLGVSWNFSCCC